MDNQSFLLDKDFLKKLDIYPRKEVYARITSLAFNEEPVEQIEGLITTGSVNVDGSSSIRRTCSLTMISDQLNLKDYNWAIKTKFRLEVGLRNEIDDRYPDICWFLLGLYVITSFTSSIQSNNRSISIQGKDKMCLLTGDLGGNLPSIIDFGREEWYDYNYTKVFVDQNTYVEQLAELYIYQEDSETRIKKPKLVTEVIEIDPQNPGASYSPTQTYYKRAEIFTVVNNLTAEIYNYNISANYYIKQKNNETEKYEYILASGNFDAKKTYYQKTISQVYHITPLTIQKIIKEAIHTWAREPYNNIIINDLDTYGLEQMIYNSRSNTPMYIIKNTVNNTFNVTVNGEQEVYLASGVANKRQLSELSIENGFIFDTGIINPTIVSYKSDYTDNYYTVLKVNDTDDCGYRITDLTYTPEDGLVCTVGEALSSILDKIKNMLGDFEYFYNLEGQFVFQRKPASANVNLSTVHNIDLQNLYVDAATLLDRVEYDFTDNYLISAINLNPTLNNVKNDYAIQGQRTTTSGAQIPIRLRYAIDKKPVYYKAIDGTIYIAKEYYNIADWELNPPARTLKHIQKDGTIEEINANEWQSLKQTFWTDVIKDYIDNIPQGDPNGPKNTFWDLHHSEWWQIENANFSQADRLTEEKKDIDDINLNITYAAGWWDLEAWQKFYETVTYQPANKNLILYSAFKQNKIKNSRSWSQIRWGLNSTHQAWITPNSTIPISEETIKSDRIFILTQSNLNNQEQVSPLGTIKVIDKTSSRIEYNETYYYYRKISFINATAFNNRDKENCYTMNIENSSIYEDSNFTKVPNDAQYSTYANIQLYEKKFNARPVETDNLGLQYITFSYPEIFGIDKRWTCDLAVQKFIKNENEGTTGAAWIFNPQFPEGSFQEAFEQGVRNFALRNEENGRYIYTSTVQIVDWRELIYQMSKDYLKYAMSDTVVTTTEFHRIFGSGINDWWPYRNSNGQKIPIANIPIEKRLVWRDIFTQAIKKLNKEYYPTGITGYEQYYTDINAFWRNLFTPDVANTISLVDSNDYKELSFANETQFNHRNKSNCYTKDDDSNEYILVAENATYIPNETYYRQLKYWVSDYFCSDDDIDNFELGAIETGTFFDKDELKTLYHSNELRGWNYKLYYNPTALDFWFDFLEDGEIADKYSVKQIGLRTKAVNNDKIKAVYFTKVPLICYYTADGTEGWKDRTDDQVVKEGGYSFVSLPIGMEKYFTISSRGISAKDELDNLLYQFSYVPENITLTSLPIYYLEPNTRIYVHDDESQIDGEYIMTKFTLPLTHNGTMSITANKAPDRII